MLLDKKYMIRNHFKKFEGDFCTTNYAFVLPANRIKNKKGMKKI